MNLSIIRILVLLVFCTPAFAGQNPDVEIFLEFQNGHNTYDPGGPGQVTATIYLGNLSPGEGAQGAEFMVDATFGGALVSYTSLLDGVSLGDPVSGWMVTSTTCIYPDGNGRIPLAELTYFYTGPAGTLELRAHPTAARGVRDCASALDQWCVRNSPSGHGAVGPGASPPAGDCPPPVGQNPDIRTFMEFPSGQNRFDPDPFSTFTVTVYMDNFGPGSGVTKTEFKVNRTFDGVLNSFTNLLGGAHLGHPETGLALAGDCTLPDACGRVAVAELEYTYFGTPGTLTLEDHPDYSRTTVDCDDDLNQWCVRLGQSGHCGIGMDPPPGECDLHPHRHDVPCEFATIQSAIDWAAAGDTVYVANGDYLPPEPLVMKNGILLLGAGYSVNIVYNGNDFGHTSLFTCDGVDNTTRIEKIRFKGGEGSSVLGGLVLCRSSSPVFDNCVFRDGLGIGLYISPGVRCEGGAPSFQACVFTNNRFPVGVPYTRGGSLLATESTNVQLSNCYFAFGVAEFGGAVCVDNASSAEFLECAFTFNSAVLQGAAVFVEGASATFQNCEISENQSGQALGAGALVAQGESTSIVLEDCSLVRNSLEGPGGVRVGSAVHVREGADAQMTGCTIAGNTALNEWDVAEMTAAVACSDTATISLVHRCLIAHNQTDFQVLAESESSIYFSATNIYDPYGKAWVDPIGPQQHFQGNFFAEPFFLDPIIGDFTLYGNSPCLPENSPSGELIGAFGPHFRNYFPQTFTINSPLEGSIHSILRMTRSTDILVLGPGIYDTVTNSFPIVLPAGVVVRGNAVGEPTILDAEGSGRVIYCSQSDDFAPPRLENVVVTGGIGGSSGIGGGLWASHSSLHLEACTFVGNEALQAGTGFGGAIFSSVSDLTLSRCNFQMNTSTIGGAIGLITSSLDLVNCSFNANEAMIGSCVGYDERFSSTHVINFDKCIIAYGIDGPAIYYPPDQTVFSCTDIYGNQGGDWTGELAAQLVERNNFSLPPGFCDPTVGDLLLQTDSPCLPALSPCGELVGALGVGECGVGPQVAVSPLSLDLEAGLPMPQVRTILVENAGLSGLLLVEMAEEAPEQEGYLSPRPGEVITRDKPTVAREGESGPEKDARMVPANRDQRKAGGPDSFGYSWVDSEDGAGLAPLWDDISSMGTRVFLTDESHLTVPLPFTFPFYGMNRTSVGIDSNGFLNFLPDPTEPTAYVDPIPVAWYPNAFIAPFWADLDPGLGGAVHYYTDSEPNRFIVQFKDVPYWGASNGLSFQVILFPDGTIEFQYHNLDYPTNAPGGLTIGIEDDSGIVGLEVAHQEVPPETPYAVRIEGPGRWISWSPSWADLGVGEVMEVEVTLDATGLPEDLYETTLLVRSNDTAIPVVSIPVTMDRRVSGVGDDLPGHFKLHGNRPNPFNPTTVISFDLPEECGVEMAVFDVAGRCVRRLLNGETRNAGRQEVVWDGKDETGSRVASGTYYYRIKAGSSEGRRGMVLLK